jgi:hypothetical protein
VKLLLIQYSSAPLLGPNILFSALFSKKEETNKEGKKETKKQRA